MKTQCEKCGAALRPDGEAYICSYECTFCPACTAEARGCCPNCGNELIRRPRRRNAQPGAIASHDFQPSASIRPWLVWTLSFGVWILLALAATGATYEIYREGGGSGNLREALLMQFCQLLTYAPVTPFAFALSVRYPVERRNWVRRCLLHLAAGAVFTAGHVVLRGITPYGRWDPQLRAWTPMFWDLHTHVIRIPWLELGRMIFNNLFDDITSAYIPTVFVAQAVTYYRKMRERELRTSQLETQLTRSHLEALKSQLQPHFLFNTLHSISALMLTDVRAADRMMTRLSDLLRMTLEHHASQLTTLKQELEFANGYLEIEKVRLDDRLSVVLEIAPDTLDAQVPSLLLQPLVENAVKHGISMRPEGGEIRIVASHDDRRLHLSVKDSGPGFGGASFEPKSGVGLRATRDRLKTLYGADQSLDIRELAEGGVEVSVRMPFRNEPRLIVYDLVPDSQQTAAAGESSNGA